MDPQWILCMVSWRNTILKLFVRLKDYCFLQLRWHSFQGIVCYFCIGRKSSRDICWEGVLELISEGKLYFFISDWSIHTDTHTHTHTHIRVDICYHWWNAAHCTQCHLGADISNFQVTSTLKALGRLYDVERSQRYLQCSWVELGHH